MPSSFAGIIFDFNGVLWWDTHLQEQSWRAFSTGTFGKTLSESEMALHIHGRNNRHSLEYLSGRALDQAEIRRFIHQKETIYRQLCLDQGERFTLSPGAIELLKFLQAHHIPHNIATASERTNLDFFIEHLRLARSFDLEQIVYDDGVRPGKPAPDIYLQAAQNLALDPGRCVVVEDAVSGIQAAHAAGIGHIIALGPAGKHRHLAQQAGVAEVVESLAQIDRYRLFNAD